MGSPPSDTYCPVSLRPLLVSPFPLSRDSDRKLGDLGRSGLRFICFRNY